MSLFFRWHGRRSQSGLHVFLIVLVLFSGGEKFAFLLTLYSMIVAGVDVCADQNVRRSLNFIGQRQKWFPLITFFFFFALW